MLNLNYNTGIHFLERFISWNLVQNLSDRHKSCVYLGITIVFKLSPGKCIKGIPKGLDDVAANSPDVGEDEGGADDGVELVGVLVQVRSPLGGEQQGLQELAESRHLADVNLETQEWSISSQMQLTGSQKMIYSTHVTSDHSHMEDWLTLDGTGKVQAFKSGHFQPHWLIVIQDALKMFSFFVMI